MTGPPQYLIPPIAPSSLPLEALITEEELEAIGDVFSVQKEEV